MTTDNDKDGQATGTGDGAAAGTGGTGAGTGGNAAPETISLTSAQLDARIQRAQATAVTGFLGELGLKSKDELAEVLKTHRETQQASMTELQRAQAIAAEAGKTAEQAHAALSGERLTNAVFRAALAAGVPGDRVDAVTRLVDQSAITLDPTTGAYVGADDAVKALIDGNAWILAGTGRVVVGTGAGAGAQGSGGTAGGLTGDQQQFAKLLGVSTEGYARAAKAAPGEANSEYIAQTLEAKAKAVRGQTV